MLDTGWEMLSLETELKNRIYRKQVLELNPSFALPVCDPQAGAGADGPPAAAPVLLALVAPVGDTNRQNRPEQQTLHAARSERARSDQLCLQLE